MTLVIVKLFGLVGLGLSGYLLGVVSSRRENLPTDFSGAGVAAGVLTFVVLFTL